MEVYRGSCLSISYELAYDQFVTRWLESPSSPEVLKDEMLAYASLHQQYKPRFSLWLYQNFEWKLTSDMMGWIEHYINIPCTESNPTKWAFVIGHNILSRVDMITFFENKTSCIYPRYFATEQAARDWLKVGEPTKKQSPAPQVWFDGVDEVGNMVIKLKSAPKDLAKAMKSFRNLTNNDEFRKTKSHDYEALTKREKEILHLYADGKRHQEVAEELFLSVHTVRTHWRNIKKKLKVGSFHQILRFAQTFGY